MNELAIAFVSIVGMFAASITVLVDERHPLPILHSKQWRKNHK